MTKNFVGAKGARLLRRVAKHILEEPRRYEQNTIISYGEPGAFFNYESGGKGRKFPACGTVACIGGWIEILTDESGGDTEIDFSRIAGKLGVGDRHVENLCDYTTLPRDHGYGWPAQFKDAYNAAKTPRKKARIAAERIEYFIKTGE